MFGNKFLFLTLQILVSFTDCQKLPWQPWSYQNVEQGFTELVKQCPCVHQPLTVQTQIQATPVAPKATVSQWDLAPLNWEKAATYPKTNNFYDQTPNIYNTDCYENIIRKYESMNKPNPVVNNYYISPPEYYKRTESDRRNRKQRPDGKRKKSAKKRRKKENSSSSNNDGKENMNTQHSEFKSKSTNNERTVVNKNGERKRRRENTNKIHANGLDNSIEVEKLERDLDLVKQNKDKIKTILDKETKNLNDKEKLLNFGENPTTESIIKAHPKYFDEEHRHTRNSKSAIEYQTKYINPQEEYSKYLQNFMNGNLSTDPYYYMNSMFPYNFDSFYKNPQTGKSTKPKNKGSKRRKNSQNKTSNDRKDEQNNEDECNTVIELTPTVYKSTPKSVSTGRNPNSKDIIINVKIQKNNQPNDDSKFSNTEPTPKQEDEYFESNDDDDDDEIRKAPLTITLYEPIVNEDLEYYPDFTILNGAYLTSSEEEELYELQNNNFHNMDQWDYYADKVKSYVENYNKKKPNVFTGSSTDINKKAIEKPKNVETIYAPSKVVIYNQLDKKIHDSREDEHNYTFKEGDTTIVLSRRID